MLTRFVKHPENDLIPPTKIGVPTESVLHELKSQFTEKPNSKYWLTCFKCGVSANLGDHQVSVSGGLITIHPSILCPRIGKCDNHYYIRQSEVIQA